MPGWVYLELTHYVENSQKGVGIQPSKCNALITRSTHRVQTSLPRQIITPILPTVKTLSLGGERLPPQPTTPPPKKKSFGSLPAP